jgi:hypothetical protein
MDTKVLEKIKYPKNIVDDVREITKQDQVVCKKLIDSAISSKETTEDFDDIKKWIEQSLAPNTVIVEDIELYEKVYCEALKTLDNQVLFGVNGEKRDKTSGLSNKITGYLGEEAVLILAKKFNIHLQLAHDKGNIENFLDKDIHKVFENSNWRDPFLNVGVKTGPPNANWLDIPKNQFVNTQIQVFAKVLCDKDHLHRFYTVWHADRLRESAKKNYLLKEECEQHIQNNLFKPVAIYLVGWADRDQKFPDLDHSGEMKRTIYHIDEYRGLLPKDYKQKIKQLKLLSDNAKIHFNSIKEFSRSDKTDLFVYNCGSIKKTLLEFKDLFKKL